MKLLKIAKRNIDLIFRHDQRQIPSSYRSSNSVFVHVPKAAGSTISLSLYGYRVGHRSIESYWKCDPAFTQCAFKFAFVRHPYFRFVSTFNYLKKGGMSTRDVDYISRYPEAFASLSTFAEASELSVFRNSILHLRPQSYYLSLPAYSHYGVFMDFIGKTEFMNEHIDVLITLLPGPLCQRLEFAKKKKLNATTGRPSEIDRDVFKKIRRIYQDDFELFGYDEWGTPDKALNLMTQDAWNLY